MGGEQVWGNQELGSLTRAVKSGHEQSAESGSTSGRKHMQRVEATRGQMEGPAAEAQRAGHVSLASAKGRQAQAISHVGQNVNKGEVEQARVTDEASTLHKATANSGEQLDSAFTRPIQG